MKQNLIVFTLAVLTLINVTGCSVVRFAETRTGNGLKRINKTGMDLDFQLGFNVADRSLRVTLEPQYYTIYKPRITLRDLGVGLAALGLLGKVLYDNWDHDYTYTFVDDTFDWYGSEPWEKAVMIGVPVDLLLYWAVFYPFDRSTERLERQPLRNHPYRLGLPDHGNISRDYLTTTGTEHIEIRNFLSELGYPRFLKDIDSLKFRASTEIGGKRYRREYTVPGPFSPPDPNGPVQIDAQWVKNHLRAGEKAALKITVKNASKSTLVAFTTITISDNNPRFHNWKLKFGDIEPGTSMTRGLGFSTDPEIPRQNIRVLLRFEAGDDTVHEEEEIPILHIE